MKKKHCMMIQLLLLLWFFLDMTGLYFKDSYLVTRAYKDDGVFFLIYLAAVLLFAFREKVGKWAVTLWSGLWFVIQFFCHEWYTVFGKGFMGTVEEKKEYFSGAVKWTDTSDRYIPDVYHTILHILILGVFITGVTFIARQKKEKAADTKSQTKARRQQNHEKSS